MVALPTRAPGGVRLTAAAAGAGKLSDEKALTQGTDLLGEFIIFSVRGFPGML